MNKKIIPVTLSAMLFALSFPAQAQQAGMMPRIGYLRHTAGPTAVDEAFRQGLRNLGWVEGKNIASSIDGWQVSGTASTPWQRSWSA